MTTVAYGWGGYRAAVADAMDGANLNSLAASCAAAAGEASDTITHIDNGTNRDVYADFDINLASLNITAIGEVALYIIPVLGDDSTFPDYTIDHSTSGNVKLPLHYYARSARFNVKNGAQSQRIVGVEIPPCKFRVAVVNQLGVAWAASGNTVQYRSYKDESV